MNSLVEEGIKPTFGGHEKFVFRNGWLKKGVDAVAADSSIFSRDEALVTLGVGKNMVRSIRHWCLATNLVEEIPGGSHKKHIQPSEMAEKLMLVSPWDPFLEDIGSLWLIHWQLISNKVRSLVWGIVFSSVFDNEFSKKQLLIFVRKELEKLRITTTEGTIEREVDCCLRTYVTSGTRKTFLQEESLDCPLAELELLYHIPEEGLYRFNIGPKPTLPTPVFGYALLDYLGKLLQNRRTFTIEEILYQNGSPGQAFKLDENSVFEYLEVLESLTGGMLRINVTAGLKQVYLNDEFVAFSHHEPYRLLEGYYGHN